MKLHERLTEWYYTHDAVQSGDVIANEIVIVSVIMIVIVVWLLLCWLW